MLNKIIFIIFQILGIYAITFMLLHFIPGDPIQVMLGDSASIADQDKLRSREEKREARTSDNFFGLSQVVG